MCIGGVLHSGKTEQIWSGGVPLSMCEKFHAWEDRGNKISSHENFIFLHVNDNFMHVNDNFMHENDNFMHESIFIQENDIHA